MTEPRTHYQVSFTSRQGLAVFAALLGAIALAYFLGLMTGLAGSEARPRPGGAADSALEKVAITPPAPSEAPFPAPVLGVGVKATPGARPAGTPPPHPTDVAAASATPSIQLFEDRASSEPTRPPALTARPAPAKGPARAPTKASDSAGFWVQVDSLSSRDQAESRRRGMAAAGFNAAVVPGAGPKGQIFRVRVGPYATREEADRAREALARKAKVAHPWVVPPGQ